MSYQFYVPTRTLFGAGKLNELHTQEMPGKKAMVVISNGKSMKETGTLYRFLTGRGLNWTRSCPTAPTLWSIIRSSLRRWIL